jgi:hypothetical protein
MITMLKKQVFSVRKQIRLRPDQVVWLDEQSENDSVTIRRLIDTEIEKQKENQK